MLVSQIELRIWSKLEFKDPEPLLIRYRQAEFALSISSENWVKNFDYRKSLGKEFIEQRQAAIFCYLMGQIQSRKIYFSMQEDANYDCVFLREENGQAVYTPVQLKELPPRNLNPTTLIDETVAKLNKYGHAPDLCVAIYGNRTDNFDPAAHIYEEAKVGQIWFYAALDENSIDWGIWGNINDASNDLGLKIRYPGYENFSYC